MFLQVHSFPRAIMEILDIILVVLAVLMPVTKVQDAVSTIRHVGISGESNAWARRLFERYGVAKVCWITVGVFALGGAYVIVVALFYESVVYKILVGLASALISLGNVTCGLVNSHRRCPKIMRAFVWTTVVIGNRLTAWFARKRR